MLSRFPLNGHIHPQAQKLEPVCTTLVQLYSLELVHTSDVSANTPQNLRVDYYNARTSADQGSLVRTKEMKKFRREIERCWLFLGTALAPVCEYALAFHGTGQG